jgi:CHRD domain
MKKRILLMCTLLLMVVVVTFANGFREIREKLTGFEEVPFNVTDASAELKARINDAGTEIAWELSYEGIESGVTQAHIHIGQKKVNGGVSVFFCGTPAFPGPAGTQTCPANAGTISGTFTAASVVGPNNQGVAPGDFDSLVRAIRSGNTYANIHSNRSPGGEIRAQINAGRRHHGHDHHDH